MKRENLNGVVVNNAGVGASGPFERVPLADHAKAIETNLLGTLFNKKEDNCLNVVLEPGA